MIQLYTAEVMKICSANTYSSSSQIIVNLVINTLSIYQHVIVYIILGVLKKQNHEMSQGYQWPLQLSLRKKFPAIGRLKPSILHVWHIFILI